MAITPPVVIPEEKIFRTVSGSCESISGTNSTLNPKLKLMAITNVALRLMSCEAMMRIPAAATVPNISKVAPPNTGSGINQNTKPTTGNKPNETMADKSKDTLYLKGIGTFRFPKSGISEKFTIPIAHETTYPIAKPMTMDLIRR